jgi:hypothetical protein
LLVAIGSNANDHCKLPHLQKPYSEGWTDFGTPADNEFVRRITTVAAIVLAFLATAMPASAKPLAAAASCNCGSLYASGYGWVGETASGAVWGSIRSGTLWVRDRDGGHDFVVAHYSTRAWVKSASAWKYKGSNMTFQAWGKWWVKAQGTGVAVSVTAEGTASLEGTGKYDVIGRFERAWPSTQPVKITLQG